MLPLKGTKTYMNHFILLLGRSDVSMLSPEVLVFMLYPNGYLDTHQSIDIPVVLRRNLAFLSIHITMLNGYSDYLH